MDPRAGLDRCGKSRLHRDSIPGPSSPYPVAIPTELPGPPKNLYLTIKNDGFVNCLVMKRIKMLNITRTCSRRLQPNETSVFAKRDMGSSCQLL